MKKEIKKIAKEFNFKYDPNWFSFMWISKKGEILLEYIGYCPDDIYNKYGKNPIQRVKNIDDFISSNDFKKCIKRYGGQVYDKKRLREEEKWTEKIQNKKLKKKLLNIHKRIRKRLNKKGYIALLTRTKIKKELDFLLKWILRHEWIHILLMKNNLYFQKINKRYWKFDEGLVTYLDAFLNNKINGLEKIEKVTKTKMEKAYFKYAIKFREILKNKKTPQGRKQALLNFYNKIENNLKLE